MSWQDWINTVQCMDCLEGMKQMPDGCVDLVVTDPPYNLNLESHGQLFCDAEKVIGDDSPAVRDAVALWAKKQKLPLCMFYSPYAPVNYGWRSVLVWEKGKHVGAGGDKETCWKRDFELIGVRDNRPLNGPRDSAILKFPALLPPPTGHVAEKPIKLMRYLVSKLSKPEDLVVDFFAGSGTTLVACKQLGRRFIGFEINPEYVKICNQRLAQEVLSL